MFAISPPIARIGIARPLLLGLAALMMAVIASPAAANPGRAAGDCVRANRVTSAYSDRMEFTNVCNVSVFVIYCGDTANPGPFCQGSRNSNYYSHSLILRAGATASAALQRGGRIMWGACEGTIGFGNDGNFTDSPDGRYTCLAR
ncbi:hypothetical protein [Roseicyclus mahoneyensis]|uniref:CVNH domain-containing protein n=1 Tax=Roseicyclus mahoneyensis TaxID=164332 RepID=A0A316GLV4_9RHOB|nr:hypothetical protein [Roseicyclus mahoneyensis]PWK62150.1 hypothetical protein C7455_101176 [Roseicyclus mahoneyensis]